MYEDLDLNNTPAPSSVSNTVQKQIDKLITEDAERQKRTMSYYQNLKKENPTLYLDPVMNTQMHKDALVLGEAFFDA